MSAVVKTLRAPTAELATAAVEQLITRGLEPSPENLLHVSKTDPSAVLYEHFQKLSPEKLIAYAEYELARRIIRSAHETVVIGGRTVETRRVEQVIVDNERRWVAYDQIKQDKNLRKALLRDVQAGLDQLSAKFSRLVELDEE